MMMADSQCLGVEECATGSASVFFGPQDFGEFHRQSQWHTQSKNMVSATPDFPNQKLSTNDV